MPQKWCYCVNVTFFHVGKNGMGMVGKVYPEGVEIFQVELNLLYKRVVPISGFSSSPLGVCHAFLMVDIFKRLCLDIFSKYANQKGLYKKMVSF